MVPRPLPCVPLAGRPGYRGANGVTRVSRGEPSAAGASKVRAARAA